MNRPAREPEAKKYVVPVKPSIRLEIWLIVSVEARIKASAVSALRWETRVSMLRLAA